ncbi:MAG: alpha/beta hydrolase [Planctomycetota bacterium]|nr:alpha/beta hydrolase [Planctomycetota bacterium]
MMEITKRDVVAGSARRACSWLLPLALVATALMAGCQWSQKKNSIPQQDTGEREMAQNPVPPPQEIAPAAFERTEKEGPDVSQTGNSADQPVKKKQSFAESFLFQPVKYPKGFEGLIVEGQRVEFKSEDGTELDGRYFRGVNPKQVVVFFHGNGGNLGFRASRMAEIQKRHQVAVFLFDYRGYGRSKGKPTISGVTADGRAAVKKAAELGNVQPSDVIVMGRSMGGAVAIQAAILFQCKGLIIESSFTSFKDIAKYHAGMFSFLAPGNGFDSENAIRNYRGKVLISHGTDDKVVPVEQGKRLFAAANQPKHFYEIEGGGHNDAMPANYDQLLAEFFSSFR